jgi:hypothetical protein
MQGFASLGQQLRLENRHRVAHSDDFAAARLRVAAVLVERTQPKIPTTITAQSHNKGTQHAGAAVARESSKQAREQAGANGSCCTYVAEVRHPRLPVAHHQCLQETRPKRQGTRDDARGVMAALTSCANQCSYWLGAGNESLALLGSPLETSAVSCNGGGGGGGGCEGHALVFVDSLRRILA